MSLKKRKCPTCGNPHIEFQEVLPDGSVYIQWMCGHQRGGGKPL